MGGSGSGRVAGSLGAWQLLLVEGCKVRGCVAEVVGSSITGEGHVCAVHNEREWGESLSRNREPWLRGLGRRLLSEHLAADAAGDSSARSNPEQEETSHV